MGKDFYQKMVSLGAHTSASFQQKILIDWLRLITSKTTIETALDIGSGLGFNLPTLAKFCRQIWATDISAATLEKSQKKHPNLKNIKYQVCDAQTLKFPDDHFDLIVCTEVLEHLRNQKKVIQECVRVLKPHSFFITSAPNYQNLTGIIKWYRDKTAGREYWDPWKAHEGGFEKRMTPGILRKLLSSQFKIRKTRGANYLLAWFYFLPLRKYHDRFPLLFLGKIPLVKNFGMEYLVLAQKND